MSTTPIYDLIGLGFGPANVAISGALLEKWNIGPEVGPSNKRVLFIEKHLHFQWHPGMLLPDARMQISFMKDLATLRNPKSPITFLSYLHSQDRLLPFINRGSTIPTRKEFADYLLWAADYVQTQGIEVRFGYEVIGVQKSSNDTIEIHSRNSLTGEETVQYARDIIISLGGSPFIPASFSQIIHHPSAIHSSAFLHRIDTALDAAPKDRPIKIAVIGGGQSAAEVTLNLRERLSAIPYGTTPHSIDMIIRKGALKPSDDSPFANEIFDPATTESWYSFPSDQTREYVRKEYKSTNYSVVNPRTLDSLYEVIYSQKVDAAIARRYSNAIPAAQPHVSIIPHTHILSADVAQEDTENFTLVLQDITSQETKQAQYDIVVCATGYQRTSWVQLLKASNLGKYFGIYADTPEVKLVPITQRLHFDEGTFYRRTGLDSPPSPDSDSSLSTPLTSPGPSMFSSTRLEVSDEPTKVYITRNYKISPTFDLDESSLKSRIYLQGMEEATHGLSDTLLSVMGVRSGEVVEDLYGKT